MLVEESMSLLWASYYAISLLVFIAVYLTFIILPRCLRLLLTWGIGGAMWAPAAMVTAVGFLENNASAFREGLLWLIAGIVLGAVIGLLIWWLRRPSAYAKAGADPGSSRQVEEDNSVAQRNEPVV